MKTSIIRPGALFAALLAASPLFSPDEARAQAMACTPTQTVSTAADANGVYTTTLTCADTSAAAGAADYRHLHYQHAAGVGPTLPRRDTSLMNNNAGNNLALTIGRGVIFTADGYANVGPLPTDAAILLYNAGAKTVTVEDGAVINLERTPRGYSATDPNRPASATTEYNPAWYPTLTSVADKLAAIAVRSSTTDGDADLTVRHDGVIEIDIEMSGTYAEAPWNYGTNAGAAIEALVTEARRFSPFTRTDIDIDIDLGPTGVIRHAEGTDGLNAIRAENASEDGDILIDLAEGSLIDVSEGGGYGVFARLRLGGPVGQQRSDIIVNAAGTIKTAVKSRVWTRPGRGMGIFAESEAYGRVRIASSGTIETVQAAAIDARATRAANVRRDDPDTEEIEGHIVDITGGTIETAGATAIYASISNYDSVANANTASANSHMTVRVAEGAAVRARALTAEDYANGAIPQETLEASGRVYIDFASTRWHGWRSVDVERTSDSGETETVKRLEPIITGIAVRDFSEVAAADAPRDQVLVDGTVETVGGKANVDPAIWLEGGGLVVVGATGRVSADSGLAISGGCSSDYRSLDYVPVDGVYPTVDCDTVEARTLEVRVAGTVDGDIRVLDEGVLKLSVQEGGVVTGTVRDPVGLPTVVGSIGRLLYTNGATVTVAQTGALTGVEVDGRTEALRSEAGDLDVTVAGRVAGDLRAPSGGTLTLNLREGGAVTGTVHDPAGLPTVVGSIGRLLYTSGATVTVAQTGALTGVEVDGGIEALRSEAGDLDVTVAGRVAGDLRAPSGGTLTLNLREGGAVTGTVHDPAGLPTVVGSIGRLLYTSGATVTVAQTGALTGVEVDGRTEALRAEAGDLDVTVAGRVAGDLRAPSGGTLTLNLREGGAVTGTVHDPAGLPTVVGSIGRLLYTSGATVTVAQTGALTGVEVDGGTEALRSEAGDLDLTVAGMVTGDVFGLGAGEHTVTVSDGGTVTGTVHLAASTVRVDGRAGRVRFDEGGTVTVGSSGWITGIEGVAIRNAAGDLVVSVAGRITGDVIDLGPRPAKITTEPDSTVAGNIDVAAAGSEVRVGGTVEGRIRFRRGGMVTVGRDGKVEGGVSRDEGELVAVVERKREETRDEAVQRAFPGGIDTQTIEVKSEQSDPASGRGVYEALPSVVLGLNDLPGFQERMAALRSAKGTGWARVEAFRGKWQADASASQEEAGVALKYRHRRHGIQAGLAGALGEEALLGVSLHHRRGSAKVSEGGDIKLHGTGVGVSGTWMREAVYVDLQAEVTEYEAALSASRLGVLKEDVSGYGHALGVEAGRRVHVEQLPAGLVLTPRAGLVHSKVSMGAFTDAVGLRVSMEDARSLKGRVGVDAEMKLAGRPHDRVFGSLEVEHEFSNDNKVMVSGTELKSEAAATWLRLGLNGVHSWDDGRYTVQGGVSYGTSGDSHEVGGGLSLNVRF